MLTVIFLRVLTVFAKYGADNVKLLTVDKKIAIEMHSRLTDLFV
jgi:hypothetical protein